MAGTGSRQRQKEQTRAYILGAAKALFLRLGYEATTTRQVAQAAGVGTGTVFAHFADKSDLLQALLLHDLDAVLAQARRDLPPQAGAVDALLHYATHLFTYYRQHWDLSKVLLRHVMFDAEASHRHLAAFGDELAARLAVDAPALDEAGRAILARCLIANYITALIGGLGWRDSTLADWLAPLEASCRLLVRPYGPPR